MIMHTGAVHVKRIRGMFFLSVVWKARVEAESHYLYPELRFPTSQV